MLLQDFLDLSRRNVDPRALDHFGAAAGVFEGSVAAKRTKIPGPKVAIGGKGGCIERGAGAEIAFAKIALDLNLSNFVRLGFAVGRRVADADLDARQGWTLARSAFFEWPMVRRHTAVPITFRGTVDVADLRRAELLGCLQDVLRRADGNARSQGCGAAWMEVRVTNQGVGHCRQGVDRGAPVPLDQLERSPRFEVALQHQRGAVADRGRQRIDGAIGPKQWNGEQDAVTGHQSLPLPDVEGILDGAVVL